MMRMTMIMEMIVMMMRINHDGTMMVMMMLRMTMRVGDDDGDDDNDDDDDDDYSPSYLESLKLLSKPQ